MQVPITAITPAVPAPQPGGAAPVIVGPTIQTGAENGLDSRFSGTAVETTLNGVPVLWAAQTVKSGGVDAIEFYEIANPNGPTPTLLQQQVITSSNLYFYYPSLSVDSNGDVVIGFSGSSLTQEISSYAVYGTTNSSTNVTTFTAPSLLKQGTGIYAGLTEANPAAAALTASSSTFSSNGGTDTITVQLAAPAPEGGSTGRLGL